MSGKKRKSSAAVGKSHSSKDMNLTMARANSPLTVPELLSHILSFAAQSTLASCAVVCGLWSKLALDTLWKHLDSVLPLLALVMDLELLKDLDDSNPDSDSLEELAKVLSSADWPRFQGYTKRVRYLSYNLDDSYRSDWFPLPPSAIAMLCLHYPNGPAILPHLEGLKWSTDGSVTPIVPFLSSQIKYLEVSIGGFSPSINDFFHAMATRSTNLESFTLRTNRRSLEVETSLLRAIRTCTSLQTLRLPPYYLRPSILEAVASLPNLKSLEQDYSFVDYYDDTAVLQELPKDSFPQLTGLSINSTPASAGRLVQKHVGLFARLEKIHLNAPDGVGNESVQRFARCLGKGCPQLNRITLDLCMRPGFRIEDVSPLSVGALEGLLPCRRLEVLDITHPFPLTITEADVERMALAWPNMRDFGVAYEPAPSFSAPDDMGNSLSILSAFAKHFPMIESLAIFLAKGSPVEFSGDLYPEYQFHKLNTLWFGVSAVPGGKSHDVAFLIASLCVQQPTIEIGWGPWTILGRDDEELSRYQREWEKTIKYLEFAMRTKITSKANISKTIT